MGVMNTLQTSSWMGLHKVNHKSCSLDNQSPVYEHMEEADLEMGGKHTSSCIHEAWAEWRCDVWEYESRLGGIGLATANKSLDSEMLNV
jgi:hypothetical protein